MALTKSQLQEVDAVRQAVGSFNYRETLTPVFNNLQYWMYLLVGIALLLWTSVGRAVEVEEPKVRLVSKTKGARLSLARIGSYYWLKMTRQLRLTISFVREHLPPPRLRVFKWLTAPQK
jgi:hypothetical protein